MHSRQLPTSPAWRVDVTTTDVPPVAILSKPRRAAALFDHPAAMVLSFVPVLVSRPLTCSACHPSSALRRSRYRRQSLINQHDSSIVYARMLVRTPVYSRPLALGFYLREGHANLRIALQSCQTPMACHLEIVCNTFHLRKSGSHPSSVCSGPYAVFSEPSHDLPLCRPNNQLPA